MVYHAQYLVNGDGASPAIDDGGAQDPAARAEVDVIVGRFSLDSFAC